jgi:excisionase family DNA binding protein
MNPAEPLVTKKEVAQHLRQTPRTVENWMAKGMPHYKLGARRTRFKLSEVETFLVEKCRVPAVR